MKRILIVDDSATIRRQLQHMLEPEFECMIASDGQEALRMIEQQKPDAIVSDLQMEHMDGLALLGRLRQNEATRTIPVVVATTVMGVEEVNQCRNLGCAGFVLKPINGDYLVAKLRQILAGR